jgi:hypothetical protein
MGYKRRTSVVALWSIDKYQPNLMILAYSKGVCLPSNGLSLCGKQLPMDVGYFEILKVDNALPQISNIIID